MVELAKKLYRSRTDKVLFGVCGGLGKYFNTDPVIFRILFVLLLFANGGGFLLYIILTLIVPMEPAGITSMDTSGTVYAAGAQENLRNEAEDLAGRAKENVQNLGGNNAETRGWLGERRNILGLVIIVAGIFLLSKDVLPLEWIQWNIIWALLIILLGFYIIFKK